MQRFARRLSAALIVVALLPGAAPSAELSVDIGNLRSAKGMLRLCLTRDPASFPRCTDDAAAEQRSVPASITEIRFDGLAPGDYALAVFHDANNNGRLDTFIGIPREGFGFSRNPGGLGPPRFKAARFTVGPGGDITQEVRLRYLL